MKLSRVQKNPLSDPHLHVVATRFPLYRGGYSGTSVCGMPAAADGPRTRQVELSGVEEFLRGPWKPQRRRSCCV